MTVVRFNFIGKLFCYINATTKNLPVLQTIAKISDYNNYLVVVFPLQQFPGVENVTEIVVSDLPVGLDHVITTKIRVYPMSCVGHCSMRLDVHGC